MQLTTMELLTTIPKAQAHYCKHFASEACVNCPAEKTIDHLNYCLLDPESYDKAPKEVLNLITTYIENSTTTYKQDLLNRYPNATLDSHQVPVVCRELIYGSKESLCKNYQSNCQECWNARFKMKG